MKNNYLLIPQDDAGDTTPANDPHRYDPTALTNNFFGFMEQFEGVNWVPYPDSRVQRVYLRIMQLTRL